LLQLQIGLGDDQVLSASGGVRFRAHDFDRRQRPDLDLFPIIGERFLRQRQRTLLHLHVLVGIHQVPINVLNLDHGRNHLLAKSDVGNLPVILGDLNATRVHCPTQALQQMLGNRHAEVAAQLGTQ